MPAGAAAFTAFGAKDLRDGADIVDEAWGVALLCPLGDAGCAGPPFCAKFLDGGGVRGGVDDVEPLGLGGAFAHGSCF